MVTTAESDVATLDVFDPAYRIDGPEVRAAREAHWYARTPMGIAVLRHDKISQLLTDRRLVQGSHLILAVQGVVEGPVPDFFNSIILSVEGEDHTRLRTLVSRAFTPRSVTALRPRMAEVTDELIDAFAGTGQCEFMADFADPYPARMICELLGVPPELHDDFRGWADDLGLVFTFTAAENLERIERAVHGLFTATDTLLAARRGDPQPDLVSALLAAESDGNRLTAQELRTMVAALLFAGQDTTRNQLGTAVAQFARHPEQWAALGERPELAGNAVTEVLRTTPAVTGTTRLATCDIEVDGTVIPSGTIVSLDAWAGNTDPAVYGPDAADFDITADRPVPPLTFGAGIHYCLGANLARAELTEALATLARRLGPIEVAGDPQWRPALGITGPVTLPLRFAPA
jgi:cytochrome P450